VIISTANSEVLNIAPPFPCHKINNGSTKKNERTEFFKHPQASTSGLFSGENFVIGQATCPAFTPPFAQ